MEKRKIKERFFSLSFWVSPFARKEQEKKKGAIIIIFFSPLLHGASSCWLRQLGGVIDEESEVVLHVGVMHAMDMRSLALLQAGLQRVHVQGQEG